MDLPSHGCYRVGMEDDESVGTSYQDMSRLRLMEYGDRTHKGVLRQESSEFVASVSLRKCEAQGSRIHGHPYSSPCVAENVEDFSSGQ